MVRLIIMKKKSRFLIALILVMVCISVIPCQKVYATDGITGAVTMEEPTREGETTGTNSLISIGVAAGDGEALANVLQILLLLTVISLAPSILIMLTSFTRCVIVLHFVRAAVGTQTVPPNQILVGLALFLTFYIMTPTFTEVYDVAIEPLSKNEISATQAFETGVVPMRDFMLRQTSDADLKTFVDIARLENIESYDDIPLTVVIPAFIISELRQAFIIGFLIYLPFIVIDMVVASTLMSMGMMMLSPTIISLPFKLLLFVMADGWSLVIEQLVLTFH